MGSTLVTVALRNSSRSTLRQLNNSMKQQQPSMFSPSLDALVADSKAFRCCAHGWTVDHDLLLMKAYKIFIKTQHDETGKFLTPQGWKLVQEELRQMDQHLIGIHHLQCRFHAINRGDKEPYKVVLYRLWNENEDGLLMELYEEIMSIAAPHGRKKVFFGQRDYEDVQQTMWYNLKCCPEQEQIQDRLVKMVKKKTEGIQ